MDIVSLQKGLFSSLLRLSQKVSYDHCKCVKGLQWPVDVGRDVEISGELNLQTEFSLMQWWDDYD